MSFLPHYCHSFRITVIPSGLLSFLPYYCHSFRISVIPSEYCHSFLIITISKYLSSWIAPVLSHTRRARKMATRGGHICEFKIKCFWNWLWTSVLSLLKVSESPIKKCLEVIFEKTSATSWPFSLKIHNWGHVKIVNAQKSSQTQTHLQWRFSTHLVYKF